MTIENEFEPLKVQVILFLDFDEESEKALQITWETAEELLDNEGIWVEIIPIHTWIGDPLGIEYADLPKILINGRTMFIGRSPSKKELKEAILDRLNKGTFIKEEAFITAARIWDYGFLAAAMIEL